MKSKQIGIFSAALTVAVIIFAAASALLKSVPLEHDFFFLFHPQNQLISERVMKGEMPFWNPYAQCGTPLLANLREAIFYPPSILFRLLRTATALRVFLILHYFLAGLFAYLFMRSQNAPPSSAWLFSTVWAFNGFLFLHSAYYNQFAGIVWIPAILLMIQNRGKGILPSAIAGCALGFQFLSGNPFFLYQTVLLCMAIEIWTIRKESLREDVLRWGRTALAFLGITAAQLLPFMEFSRISDRHAGILFEESMRFSEPGVQILRFLAIPFWNRIPISIDGDPTITGLYVGVPVLLLAGMGVLIMRNRHSFFWAIGFTFSVLLSMGSFLPGYRFLWNAVPGMQFLRFPSQWICLSIFCLAVLAAQGAGCLPWKKIRWTLVVLIAMDLFLFSSKNPFGVVHDAFFSFTGAETRMIQNSGMRIVHPMKGFGLGDHALETEEDWMHARRTLLPNLSVPYHIASASGYGVPETRWKSELRSVLAGSRNGEELWNTITASPLRMSYRPAQERNLPFIRPGPALPYAARLGFAIFEKDGHSVLDAGFDPFKEVVIAGEDKVSDFTDPKRAEDIPILERTPEKITVDAKKGWIYLAESYDPGWKAYLNGTRCTISRANGAFMAVLANGSQNKVVFDYSVPGFKAGCGLTILFAGFLTILVLRKGNEYQDKG